MNPNQPLRYALVHGLHVDAKTVSAYLPGNYRDLGEVIHRPFASLENTEKCLVIGGRDHHGWTLDDYVIPRLGNGLMRAEEIDSSHPVMMQLPVFPNGGGDHDE
jgi:hypothetical protein